MTIHVGDNTQVKGSVPVGFLTKRWLGAIRFSNGSVGNADKLDFSLYKSADEVNPRKKSRRILVAETDRLSYVGSNFGAGSLKCNSLCNYYVGVLNKRTKQMEVHSAQLFNMQPTMPGETDEAKSEDTTRTYRDKVDSLIEAFGTNKQKRALTSRRLNQVGSDTLHQAVAKAASNVIDQKGLEALQQEVADMESQGDLALHLPPCDATADKPENVYMFDDLLSPVEFAALETAGSKMAALTTEELQKMTDDGRCLCVVAHLENMPGVGEARDKVARCAFYLSLLLKLARQKSLTRKFGQEEGCPRIILSKLFKTFTVETFSNGRVVNILSTSMRAKLAAYSLALLLHMGHMTADLTLLHRDLGITEARMIEVAKSMGLTLIKPARTKKDDAELQGEHRQASLRLPLVKSDKFTERRKRKKMI
ncbi:putative DNA-directed RNA polymerase I subunit RPA49 isoform 2 [Scophthalmus maximus]|uniref:Putative DNA-directed RNA polymerase I subunit RPA49 isoform 2 n=1 Tax=Scophthalmus maximus TaxID=52904 RepID=A0A2U9BPP1_SCOMX|nr:putative DNA-directed RNA polymerase I subunit RPA49 isoform 2 [Scophthalmus maximus]